jgi:purine-cytosine permease-like protein
MDPRARLFVWIGALAGLVGFWVFNVAPLDDLLPLNQALFAVLCALLVIWLFASVARRWGERT